MGLRCLQLNVAPAGGFSPYCGTRSFLELIVPIYAGWGWLSFKCRPTILLLGGHVRCLWPNHAGCPSSSMGIR